MSFATKHLCVKQISAQCSLSVYIEMFRLLVHVSFMKYLFAEARKQNC